MKSAFNIAENRITTFLSIINKPARSSLLLTATNIFAKCCSLVFTPIFTRILSPTEYGAYSLFLSYLSVLLVIGTLEISQGSVYRAMQKQRDTLNLTLLTGVILTVLASVGASVFFTIIMKFTGNGEIFPRSSIYLALLCISNGIINLYLAKSRFLYRWRAALVAACVQSFLIPILGILVIGYLGNGVDHVIAKISVALVLTLALSLVFLGIITVSAVREARAHLRGFSPAVRAMKSSAKTLIKLSLPLLPYYLSIMLISQANRHFILNSFGEEAVAIYSVAYSLGIALSSAFSGIIGSLCPWIMRKIRAGEFLIIDKTTSALIRIIGLGIISVSAFFPEMLTLIAPKQYSSGLSVSIITALSPLPLSLISLTSSAMIARERVKTVLLSGAVGATVAIALNPLLLPRLGIAFSALVTLISYSLVFLIQSLGIKRVLGRNMISSLGFGTAFISTAFFLLLIYFLRDRLVIRALISTVFFMALILTLRKSKWILSERKVQ